VIAADCARSPMRDLVRVKLNRSQPPGRRVNIYFHTDVVEQTRNRPYILWTGISAATQGVFIALDGRSPLGVQR
jgi:putative polyketide hydroxylase